MQKRTILGLIILLLLMLGICKRNVKAEDEILYEGTIHRAEYISDVYVHKEKEGEKAQDYHAGILRKSTDHSFVYCLEPFVTITDDYKYSPKDSDYANLLNLTAEKWHRIELLAYYGYNYIDSTHNHNTPEWYYVTQMEIWRTIDDKINVYFTNGLKGEKIERFTSYFTELNDLVTNHDILPNITIPENISINQEIVLEDANNVLANYEVTSTHNLDIKPLNNKLIIKGTSLGEATINFRKKGTLYSKNPILYFSNYIQKTLEVGNYTPQMVSLNTNIKGTKLIIKKIDNETGKDLALANIKFQIKDKNNDIVCLDNVCEFKTDEKGTIILSKPLGYGTYTLEELDSSMPGYTLNLKPLKFVIDEETNEELEIHFPNERVKGKLIIHKTGEKLVLDNNTYYYDNILLDNVVFNIYANEDIYVLNEKIYEKDDLVATLITSKGIASLDLELGSYYIVEQASSNDNLVNNKPLYFDLTYENNKTQIVTEELEIPNFLPKGTLIFLKIDKENNLVLKDTYIQIYTSDNKLIYEGKTDENGLITINDLPLGSYYLKEIKAPDGYNIKDEPIPFSLTKDKETVKITMNNSLKKTHDKYEKPQEDDDEPEVKDYYVEVPNTDIVNAYNFVYIIPKKYYHKR